MPVTPANARALAEGPGSNTNKSALPAKAIFSRSAQNQLSVRIQDLTTEVNGDALLRRPATKGSDFGRRVRQ